MRRALIVSVAVCVYVTISLLSQVLLYNDIAADWRVSHTGHVMGRAVCTLFIHT